MPTTNALYTTMGKAGTECDGCKNPKKQACWAVQFPHMPGECVYCQKCIERDCEVVEKVRARMAKAGEEAPANRVQGLFANGEKVTE